MSLIWIFPMIFLCWNHPCLTVNASLQCKVEGLRKNVAPRTHNCSLAGFLHRKWISNSYTFQFMDHPLAYLNLQRKFICFCKLADTFHRFLHVAWKNVYTCKCHCCREPPKSLLPQNTMSECSIYPPFAKYHSMQHLNLSIHTSKFQI